MNKILVTGGAGFIGSHIVDALVEKHAGSIRVVDKMTYAADFRNISDHVLKDSVELRIGDVCDADFMDGALAGVSLVIHAAAESHVDNSFGNSTLFTRSNVLGTHVLLEAARKHKVPRIVHVSTDEVYGEVLDGEAIETSVLAPTNPYSASKAAAEMIALGYLNSFKLPLVIIRANNVFGTRQYPEKLIPKSITSILQGQRIPLHGSGRNKRHFLAAQDAAAAILFIAEHGLDAEIYNIGSKEEFENIAVVKKICAIMGADFEAATEFVEDRPFNDRRYAVNADKLTKLGFVPHRSFDEELPKVVEWYKQNIARYI